MQTFTSYTTYGIWRNKWLKRRTQLTRVKKNDDFRSAHYGGPCYPTRTHSTSSQYEDLMAKISSNTLTPSEFEVDLDVVSIYPTAMLRAYPIGEHIGTEKEIDGKRGIYRPGT